MARSVSGLAVVSVINSIPWDGQRISRPGIYANIPLNDYHRGDICDGPSLSSSSLRLLWSKSPKHFWDKSPLNPQRQVEPDNENFILGRATHHLICGEMGFAKLFAVRPEKLPDPKTGNLHDWNGNRNVCKDWLALQRRAGKSVLTSSDVEAIKGMAYAIGQDTFAREALNGLVERSMFWKDRETGVWLKARPDVIPTASGDFVDLKTTESVLYPDLQYSLDQYGYVQQGALVAEGVRALDLEFASFTLIWVEKKRPHCIDSSTLIDEDLVRGVDMNRVAIRKFHRCFTAKSWPGPAEERGDARNLQLSDRARERIDNRLLIELKQAA